MVLSGFCAGAAGRDVIARRRRPEAGAAVGAAGGAGAMSSTSQKHRDFVAEPMGEKPVGTLAGIGDVLGKKLEEKGFDKAYVVLGQFLVLRKDEELFREWLKETCGANAKQSRDCSGCLREWCDAFL
ncbi:barrier-to-autointegration factor [Chroicocephalus ridibundus]|uniref:barrier-to-autointegration factor n=1 Tax=Chroicocephalus ridibundus TaxID=1192867 RepID=UPI002FDEF9FF